jgi:Uncharacterised nucleotidyltransferase
MDQMIDALKRASGALDEAGVTFMLGGSLSTWARGGPETLRDLDLMVKREDADRALDALAEVGMRTERPPEGWLYKAWDGPVGIDVIFEPKGVPVTDELIARSDKLSVMSVPMLVMPLEDVLTTKLLALEEHSLDYSSLLQMARSLREQVDWGEIRRRTSGSPFARAFFVMLEGLHIVAEPAEGPRASVRVIGPEEASGHEGV